MLFRTKTPPMDATKLLSCHLCPLNYQCARYSLACELTHNHLYFSAKIICILESAEQACTCLSREIIKENMANVQQRIKALYELFLPEIFNYWNAYRTYELSAADEYSQNALLFALCDSLESFEMLERFDFLFRTGLEKLREKKMKTFKPEIEKYNNFTDDLLPF
jgi:hypothetical protein